MPNWCQNRVTFSGDNNQVEEIKKLFFHETPFQNMIPQPPEEELPQENESLPGWYSWRLDNWGTKWDISQDDISISDDQNGCLQLEFFTAWAPPEGICNFLREKYGNVSVTWFYDEPGMCDAGYI
jgi:hypothetical protein